MQSKSKIAVTMALMGALVFVSMVLDRYLSPYLPVSFAIVTLTVTVSFGLIRDNPWSSFFGTMRYSGIKLLHSVALILLTPHFDKVES